jgi:hypothetical protein
MDAVQITECMVDLVEWTMTDSVKIARLDVDR